MHIKKGIFLFISCFISTAGFSGAMEPLNVAKKWSALATLSAGPLWTNGGKTQTFYLQPDLQQTYTANQNLQTLGGGEVFLGVQRFFSPSFQSQLGLAAATITTAHLHGDVWQDADPRFNNFAYSYKVNHARITLKGLIISEITPLVQPYLSAGLGIAFNRSYGFKIQPKIFEVITQPPFANNKTQALTYTLGAGMQYPLTTHSRVGVGYEFADWGKSHLAAAPGQTINTGIPLENFYTHQLLFFFSIIV